MAKLTAEQRMASIEATQLTILQRLDAIEAQLATWTATFIKNDLLNRVVNLENVIGIPVVNPTAKKGK